MPQAFDAASARLINFPRVLFLTPHAFNHLTGGGVTFSNLFKGWPKDRLATVHSDAVPTTDDVCDKYYMLGREEIDLAAPLRMARALRNRRGGQANAGAPSISSAPAAPGLLQHLLGDSIPQRASLTPALECWIADFKPDVLYTILGNNAFMQLVEDVKGRFSLPTVVHLMDDWSQTMHRSGVFAPFEKSKMQALLCLHIQNAAVRLGISDAMAEEFGQRYGKPFTAIQNTVDIARWRDEVRHDGVARGKPFRVIYVGSIFPNAQLNSLIDLCHSAERLSASGLPITLEIASPPFLVEPVRDHLEVGPNIRLIPAIEDDKEFYKALSASDVLLLPVNFDADSVSFIRYSMPTKVPAYLVSGTPILVYGPKGVAQVDYAVREEWGHVVSSRDSATLDAGLRAILTNDSLRARLHNRAQEVAKKNHNGPDVRMKFQSAMTLAARAANP